MTYAQIGSVSHGTLRTQDLVEAFSNELGCLVTGDYYSELLSDAEKYLAAVNNSSEDEDEGQELVSDLIDALCEYAPPYCYFGTHEGDVSDFGFWVNWEFVDECRRNGILPSGDELPEHGSTDATEFLVVTDHGNASLYQLSGQPAKWIESWSVV